MIIRMPRCTLHLTNHWMSQLSTHDFGINAGEAIVTDCAPLVIITYLHSSFMWIKSTHKTNSTTDAGNCSIYWNCDKNVELHFTFFSIQHMDHFTILDDNLQCNRNWLTSTGQQLVTWTLHTNITRMATPWWSDSNPSVGTVCQELLTPRAGNIVNQYCSCSSSKVGIGKWNSSCTMEFNWCTQ